jgi:hypothetical protein
MDMPADDQRVKLITFKSWVSRWEWYEYARSHPDLLPHLLIDRSPCQDPFLDPYAPSGAARRPLISGLCRLRRNFRLGERLVYSTKIHPQVRQSLGIPAHSTRSHYFGAVALTVVNVWDSHGAAANSFVPRRYVVSPNPTPYPPNLAHAREPISATARESCINYDDPLQPRIPTEATDNVWHGQYLAYHVRQREHALRVAECRIYVVDGLEALQLSPDRAPVFVPEDWGGQQIGQNGNWIPATVADELDGRSARGETRE